jgi:hypothetical protein
LTGLTAAFLTTRVFLGLGLATSFFLMTFVFLATTFLASGFYTGLAFTTDFDADLLGDLRVTLAGVFEGAAGA